MNERSASPVKPGTPYWLAKGSSRLPSRPTSGALTAARCRAILEELLATAEENGDIGFSYMAHDNLSLFGFIDNDPKAVRPHVEREIELEAELGQESSWADTAPRRAPVLGR